ncbi:MAG: hypothetical protein ACP5MD_10150 [Verrucomicrobiia bacterium]
MQVCLLRQRQTVEQFTEFEVRDRLDQELAAIQLFPAFANGDFQWWTGLTSPKGTAPANSHGAKLQVFVRHARTICPGERADGSVGLWRVEELGQEGQPG